MSSKRETRPSRQANGRETQKSKAIVSQNESLIGGLFIILFPLFAVFVVPRIMYHFIAPAQGWV